MRLSDAAMAHLRGTLDQPDPGPRYMVHELLGRGGMGMVYRAEDTTLARSVALKVLTTAADAPDLAQRLSREARVLARLDHPGIVAVHDAGLLADGRPFYVMRLVRGTRLDRHAVGQGRGELLRVFLRVCDAVAYAHARGVIHRDLTPANVMVGAFGDVLVLDWGVAKVASESEPAGDVATDPDSGLTGAGDVIGTPGFMAPEQAAGAAATADARADIYGLGAMLRHVLRVAAAPVPRPLAAIIERAMATDPVARYATVEALADDVRHWLDSEPVSAYRERLLERGARLYRRNQTLILLLLGYAVVRTVILIWRGI